MKTICSDCGTAYEMDGVGTCDECRPQRDYAYEHKNHVARIYRGSRHERGYDNEWARLSKRARDKQPWCSDCGRPDDLTTDHSVTAWERRAAGKSIRLRDVDVVCRSCNSVRGAARGADAADEHRSGDATDILEVIVTSANKSADTWGEGANG